MLLPPSRPAAEAELLLPPSRPAAETGLLLPHEPHGAPSTSSTPSFPRLRAWFACCLPGLLMAPVGSVIVACNAAHSNPEHLCIRWTRGLAPRTLRDVIFGLGLNELSEGCARRMPCDWSSVAREAAGSLIAGLVAGYVSHVPHNLSQLKLLQPQRSYAQHARRMLADGRNRVPHSLMLSPGARAFAGAVLAVIWPTAVLLRAAQIGGSFCIINGVARGVGGVREEG